MKSKKSAKKKVASKRSNKTSHSTRKAAYKAVRSIEVSIWGNFVGAVALDPQMGFYAFAFDPSFVKTGIQLSPLKMSLREEPYIFPNLPEATFKRLPAMLADALPDDFGNALVNSYMAQKGVAASAITSVDRLAYMGKRAMGALEFKPTRGPKTEKSIAIELGELITEARRAVQGKISNDKAAKSALRNIIEVGTSAGGARAKAVIAWNPVTQEIRSGQVNAPEGFEHWLLKFDGMGKDRELGSSQVYGRIEYAYYLMATDAGISMSKSRLLEEGERAHFMTKRFDRDLGNIRHHMQTLCAMNHIDYKLKGANSYEQLFMTNEELGLGHYAQVECFRRMVFNVMARNCDDHSKNFSYLLREGAFWELAPAYDITFAHNPKGEWTHQHLMSVNGKFDKITREDLVAVADRFGVGESKQVITQVRESVKSWSSFAKQAGVPSEESAHIKKQLKLLR